METELDMLMKLGLKGYEAKVFLALVRLGEATSADITKHSRVPRTSIYHVCDALCKNGLITRIKSKGFEKSMRWGVVQPITALIDLNRSKFMANNLIIKELNEIWNS